MLICHPTTLNRLSSLIHCEMTSALFTSLKNEINERTEKSRGKHQEGNIWRGNLSDCDMQRGEM